MQNARETLDDALPNKKEKRKPHPLPLIHSLRIENRTISHTPTTLNLIYNLLGNPRITTIYTRLYTPTLHKIPRLKRQLWPPIPRVEDAGKRINGTNSINNKFL
jgi:hypothetical protein